ncbi:MAG: RDD family protein [Candidatus Methanofastidiosia archaeon]
MICPQCGARNDIGVRFCKKCGSNLQHLKEYSDYVGVTLRACAFLIDILVVTVPLALVLWITTDLSFIMIVVVLFLAGWVYNAALESSSPQATLGKMATGIKVVDKFGKRISFGTASVRYFAKVLTLVFQGSYWYLVSFSEKRQAIHDMAAGTYVVMKGVYSQDEPTYNVPHWYEAYKH